MVRALILHGLGLHNLGFLLGAPQSSRTEWQSVAACKDAYRHPTLICNMTVQAGYLPCETAVQGWQTS